MKARPILFSAPMIRALIAGTKTQTRRILKSDWNDVDDNGWPISTDEAGTWHKESCPYGGVGQLLWARETWAWPGEEQVIYRADAQAEELIECWRQDPNFPQVKWRPSIFMPRRHSRITLRITEVRVQRLMDITEADAIAEGIERDGHGWKSYEIIHQGRHKGERHPHAVVPNGSPMLSYRELWESINGADSWAATMWVWAISFEVIQKNVAEVMQAELA